MFLLAKQCGHLIIIKCPGVLFKASRGDLLTEKKVNGG